MAVVAVQDNHLRPVHSHATLGMQHLDPLLRRFPPTHDQVRPHTPWYKLTRIQHSPRSAQGVGEVSERREAAAAAA